MNQDEMNKVYKKMDELCKKDKKDGKADADDFTACFNIVLKENGYTPEMENYFFKGFSYMGAIPLYSYVVQSKDSYQTFLKIMSGNRYKKDNRSADVKKKLIFEFEFLALLIKNQVNNNELIKHLIVSIPKNAKTKDGVYTKYLPGIFQNNFINICFSENMVLPDLDKMNLTPKIRENFIETVKEALTKTKLAADDPNTKKIFTWIGDVRLQENSKKISENVNKRKCDEEPKKIAKSEEKKEEIKPNETSNSKGSTKELNEVLILKNKLKKLSDNYEKLLKDNSKLNANFSHITRENIKIVDQLKQEINKGQRWEEKYTDLQSDLSNAREQVGTLMKHEEELNKQVEAYKESYRVLQITMNKKIEEYKNALAQKLQAEYSDFLDAKEANMDLVLGENMRYQLDSVFEILKANGIPIK